MTLSIDQYLRKSFDEKSYNCWDMARDVWRDLKGQELQPCRPAPFTREAYWVATTQRQCEFRELASPESPCLVLMQRAMDIPHIGVFIDGNVLHLRRQGAIYQPLAMARFGFPVVLYYTTKDAHADTVVG